MILKRFNPLSILLMLAVWAVPTAALAEVVQTYEYAPDKIYTVRAGLGITTQIELSPDENILDYSTGFSSGWDLTRRDNVFYLKPKNVDVDTNMMIRTETHSYILELKVVATDWRALDQAKNAGVHYKIRFAYPNDTKFAEEKAPETQEINTKLQPDRAYNFNYQYSTRSKHTWLVPANVYDDGQFTYIKMPGLKGLPTDSFPAVFGREKKRSEDFVVNTTVENDTLVVHGIYPFLVIRHGDDVIGLRRSLKP